MPRTLIWAILGVVAWAVLQIIAVQWCTGWRDEKAKYGLGAVVLLAWWLPNLLFGERLNHCGDLLGGPDCFGVCREAEFEELKA